MLDADPKPPVNAHPLVCQPRKQEKREYVAPPIVDQNPEAREYENENRNPVAKAIFTGENVEKLAD